MKDSCYKCHGIGFMDPNYDQMQDYDLFNITCPVCNGSGSLRSVANEEEIMND